MYMSIIASARWHANFNNKLQLSYNQHSMLVVIYLPFFVCVQVYYTFVIQ